MGIGLGSLLGSAFNPINLASLAMGPAGWASYAMRTIGSQVAMNALQQIGQRLGMPQVAIDIAQAAFARSAGMPGLARQNLAEAVRGFVAQGSFSARDAGQLLRTSERSLQQIVNAMNNQSLEREAEKAGGKNSFLVALAKAMGKAMDRAATKMKDASDQIETMTSGNGKLSESEQTKLSSKMALLQAYGQELSILSNAFATVSKAFGEANATAARK